MFDSDKIEKVLNVLSDKDHFFVSEAHLQCEFIIEASKLFKEYDYYPEYTPAIPVAYSKKHNCKRIRFDLLIKGKTEKVIIEFKYLTNEYKEDYRGMHIEVKSHLALDIRRYDVWKDIERMEHFVKDGSLDYKSGYLILITNSSAFYDSPKRTNTNDSEFHIQNGQHFGGIKKWALKISDGTKKGREDPICITGDYYFDYKKFYSSGKKNGEFKYLIVEIKR